MTRRLAMALALVPTVAHAHLVNTGLGPVYDGVVHFAVTPEVVIPAFALAAFAGLRGAGQARRVIFALPIAWLAAGLYGASVADVGQRLPAWLPLLVLGGLVVADVGLPSLVTMSLAVAVGAGLGYANGGAMALTGAGIRGVAGSTAALFVVATLCSAATVAWRAGWIRIVWRVAGSWIAAGGLLLLGWSLR